MEFFRLCGSVFEARILINEKIFSVDRLSPSFRLLVARGADSLQPEVHNSYQETFSGSTSQTKMEGRYR